MAIADQQPENAYIDMVLRMGEGRGTEDRQAAGERIIETAATYCAELMGKPHFALSLEIVEIQKDFSWKKNTMHPRLAK